MLMVGRMVGSIRNSDGGSGSNSCRCDGLEGEAPGVLRGSFNLLSQMLLLSLDNDVCSLSITMSVLVPTIVEAEEAEKKE